MNCAKVLDKLPLLLYGELSFDEEEQVEQHAASCESCRRELDALRQLHESLDQAESAPPADLLQSCRRELRLRLREARAEARNRPWTARWAAWLTAPALLRPAGAFALLAVGFLGARLWNPAPEARPSLDSVPLAASRVRFVEPAKDGSVRITLEETRQRQILGRVDDSRIRELLLAAAQDPGDPGLRVETIDLLKGQSLTADVRSALLSALRNDDNAGVRLKALEGVKPYAADPEVRRVLTEVLLHDDNPGIRTQAIELLTRHKQRDVVGPLQQLMQREENDYIRERTRRLLRDLNASVDSF
jgi:hypothetical protein